MASIFQKTCRVCSDSINRVSCTFSYSTATYSSLPVVQTFAKFTSFELHRLSNIYIHLSMSSCVAWGEPICHKDCTPFDIGTVFAFIKSIWKPDPLFRFPKS